VAALIAGGMNAIAGGGSFLIFPGLVFSGVPSVVANASTSVVVVPGSFTSAWAYRHNFRNFDGVPLWVLIGVNLTGSILGAILLLTTSQHSFDVIVPWLLLAGALIFTFGPQLAPRLRRIVTIGPVTFMVLQFIIAIYGGYFGSAVGIISMALWSLLGHDDIHEMNAAKTLVVGVMSIAAVVCFVIAGKVAWPQTLVMMAACAVGGYGGARIARHFHPRYIRASIIAISFGMTAVFFLR